MTVQRMSKKETWENLKVRRISASSFHSTGEENNLEDAAEQDWSTTTMQTKSRLDLLPEKAKTTRTAVASSVDTRKWRSMSIRSHVDKDDDVVCMINDPSTILDAIISPDRLNALLACDDQVLTYEPRNWTIILQHRGRNVSMIAMPLFLLTLWCILWIVLLDYVDGMSGVKESLADLSSLISPLLVPVSFLLVFRLGRAAVRFWDARMAIGKIVEMCRTLISTAAVGCKNIQHKDETDYYDSLLDDFARWTCAFPIAVKNFLRPVTRSGWGKDAQATKRQFEFGQLLSDAETMAVLNAESGNFGTIYVLNRLRELVWMVGSSYDDNAIYRSNSPREMLYKQLNEHIDTLTGAWGACERINGTPLPLVYVMHLRTFLILYLLLWEMEAAANHGWVALPVVFLACWGLLGIEAAAVECERPFQWYSNHLALGKACVVASANVAQTIRNIRDDSAMLQMEKKGDNRSA